jgi:hypothetical protein
LAMPGAARPITAAANAARPKISVEFGNAMVVLLVRRSHRRGVVNERVIR